MNDISERTFIDWSLEEFQKLKHIPGDFFFEENNSDIFDSIVILPTEYIHDSGFRYLSFVLIRKNEPMGIIGGASDVVHINGMTGFGFYNRSGDMTDLIEKSRALWTIDCLPKAGLLRLFNIGGKIKIGHPEISSFEVFAVYDETARHKSGLS